MAISFQRGRNAFLKRLSIIVIIMELLTEIPCFRGLCKLDVQRSHIFITFSIYGLFLRVLQLIHSLQALDGEKMGNSLAGKSRRKMFLWLLW